MRNFINRFTIIAILNIIALFFIVSCKEESTEPKAELSIDENLVGTWELTKITKPILSTPEAAGIALTAVFNQDATLKFTTITLADTNTTIDTGIWSTSDTTLTITLTNEQPKSSPYVITENIVTIKDYSLIFNGSPITATLEFTKQ